MRTCVRVPRITQTRRRRAHIQIGHVPSVGASTHKDADCLLLVRSRNKPELHFKLNISSLPQLATAFLRIAEPNIGQRHHVCTAR